MNQKRLPLPSKGLDVFGAVEELHNLSAKEMNKLLRDSQHLFTLRLRTGRGSFLRVNLERLVSRLPLHLLACLASRGTEPRLRYLLRGVRLLHSFSDLALRHPKLEQSFLQEVKIREQILDLIIYMLITLAGPEQEGRHGSSFTILHAALVACSLHLLPAFVAGEWSDLVPVLLVHPKVDIFMDAAFDAVRRDIGLLQTKLRALNSKLMSNRVSSTVAESMAEVISQQCEASVQVLQSLCQPHAFRDKVLNHKELCRNGGVLHLVLTVLKLHVPFLLAESKYLVSLVARLKSKILSLMVKFCETESVSFLDEVAADARTMHLAEMVAAEVFTLVRKALIEEPRESQDSDDEEDEMLSGLLYIHAMRMADIFSDDSNFRNSVMDFIAPDLAKVLAQSPTTFLTSWCGGTTEEIKPGSDSVLIYDPFRAAGAAMHSFKSSGSSSARASGSANALLPDDSSGCSLSAGQLQFASYSQERSSLFIKILANLHCFNPEICPANEKDRFLNLFVECLMVGPFTPGNSAFFLSTVQTAVRVCENLFMLLDHVSSLSSEVVSDEDLQLVSTFYCSLHDAICPSAVFEDAVQEDPVVAYVRDAHEQKRKVLLGQWQRSERWKRIHSFEPSDDKEQSNAGSSINKSMSNTSSSQQAVDEQDTSGIVENFDEVPIAKRNREASDAEEEMEPTRKRQHKSQSWETENTEMDWAGEESEIHEKNNVLDAEVEKYMAERRFIEVSDDRARNHVDSSHTESTTGIMTINSGLGEDFSEGFHKDAIVHRMDLGGACGTDTEEISLDRETINGTKQASGEITKAISSKDVLPVTDIEPLDGDSLLNSGTVASDRDGTSMDFKIEKLNHDSSSIKIQMGDCFRNEEIKTSCQSSPKLFNTRHVTTEDAPCTDSHDHKPAIQCDSAMVDTETSFNKPESEHSVNEKKDVKHLNCGVEVFCVDTAADTESISLAISSVSQNATEVDNKNTNAIQKSSLKKSDIAGDPCLNAHPKFQETKGCDDSKVSRDYQGAHQASSGNNENKEKLCVQHGFDLKFELKVEGLEVHVSAVQHQAQSCKDFRTEETQQHSSSSLVVDKSINGSQIDASQENVKSDREPSELFGEECSKASICDVPQVPVCEVPQVSMVEAPQAAGPAPSQVAGHGMFHVSGLGTTSMFGLGGPQLSLCKDSFMYASKVPSLDSSRFAEAKPGATGRPLPSPVQRATIEELQPRKRKRNIMSDDQMAVMENALLTEPYLRRHPDLIMQWTSKLNKMGPEISYQQLKNWLNNRKARLARQRAGDLQARDGETRTSVYNHDGSAPGSSTCSGSSNDPNRSTSEDGANTRDSGSTSQARKPMSTVYGTPLCKLATEDIDTIMDYDMSIVCRSNMPPDLTAGNGNSEERNAYANYSAEIDLVQGASHRSAPVKFVKCEAGQYVSLLDKDGREAATGTLYQVEGFWQGKRIDEHGICIVKIMDLNVEKTTRLPHPSVMTGNTFEEAEKLCGQMIVAWDTKRIFLIS